MVNLVRSGTKQPQPFSTSAEGQARHLPLSVRSVFLPLRSLWSRLFQMPVAYVLLFALHGCPFALRLQPYGCARCPNDAQRRSALSPIYFSIAPL